VREACSTYGREERSMGERRGLWGRGVVFAGVWWGNLREGDHLEDSGVDGRIIFRWIYRKWVGGIDWIELA